MSEGYLNTEYAVVDRCVGTGGYGSCKDVQSEEFLAREGAGDEWDGERREEESLGRRIVPGARGEKDPRRARVRVLRAERCYMKSSLLQASVKGLLDPSGRSPRSAMRPYCGFWMILWGVSRDHVHDVKVMDGCSRRRCMDDNRVHGSEREKGYHC